MNPLITTCNEYKSCVHKLQCSRSNNILNIPEIYHMYAETEFLATFL